VLVQRNPQFGTSGSDLAGSGSWNEDGEEGSLGLGLRIEQPGPRSRSSSQSRISVGPSEDVSCAWVMGWGMFCYIFGFGWNVKLMLLIG
jgi:hypothetical protein